MADLTAADFGFTAAFLKKHSDVKKVIDQAIAEEWTTTRTIAAVKGTKWWTSKTDAQRRYDLMAAENPYELRRMREQAKVTVTAMMSQMGFQLPYARYTALVENVIRNGMSEQEIRQYLGANWRFNEGTTGQGQVIDRELRETASAYGLRLAPITVRTYTRRILQGLSSVDAYKNHLQVAAEKAYPTIAEALRAGFTVRQVLDPYIEYAAAELGVNPQTIDPSVAKWNRVLSYRGDTGKDPARVMSMDEWTKTIRTDKQYGWDKTQTAQRQATVLSAQLMQAFGAA